MYPSGRVAFVILLLAATFAEISHSSLFAPAALGRDTPPPQAVLSERTILVVVPVSVTDRSGHFVLGLKQSNFEVYENGKPQEIVIFRDIDMPVTVAIVVDHSGSMAAKSRDVIQGATALVEASNPADKEFVVNFGSKPSLGLPPDVPFTSNVDELKRALSTPSASGLTALYDAMVLALQHFQGNPADKRVMLLISDGGDNASRHKFGEVLRMAEAANVIIYPIGLLDPLSADQNPNVLRKFARETGGEAYFPNSTVEVVSTCIAIATDIRHQYTLGYTPPQSGKNRYRSIRVAVHAPGRGRLFVRARKGYSLPVDSSEGTDDTSTQGHQ
jgi:Ca-activated chloride channel homolog